MQKSSMDVNELTTEGHDMQSLSRRFVVIVQHVLVACCSVMLGCPGQPPWFWVISETSAKTVNPTFEQRSKIKAVRASVVHW